jgi:hypothetical protein
MPRVETLGVMLLSILVYNHEMPVQLPNAPAENTPLSPQLHDPPTLVNISNAIAYNKQVLVSCGRVPWMALPSYTSDNSVSEAGVATKKDVGAGAVYQAAVIARNASRELALMT